MSDIVWEMAAGALIEVPDSIETPALVVDLDRVRRNLAEMSEFADASGAELTPHVKTHRTIEFAQMQVDAGSARLCVAKLTEAEHFVDAGFENLVMAYPIAGTDKYLRAAKLVTRADIRLSVDSHEAARGLSQVFAEERVETDVLVIVDTGFRRTGVAPQAVLPLAREIHELEGLRLKGIITHEGHAAGAGTPEDIQKVSAAAGEQMADIARAIRAEGLNCDVVSVGSTATVKYSATPGVTEIRPGIYAFNDYGQVSKGTVPIDRCAARVLATVVSHAEPGRAIIDAGSKTLSQDRLSIWGDQEDSSHGLIIGHPGWKLTALSEEHGWLEWAGNGAPSPLPIGEKVQVLPVHICSVFHEMGRAEVIEDGAHTGTWESTARGLSR